MAKKKFPVTLFTTGGPIGIVDVTLRWPARTPLPLPGDWVGWVDGPDKWADGPDTLESRYEGRVERRVFDEDGSVTLFLVDVRLQ